MTEEISDEIQTTAKWKRSQTHATHEGKRSQTHGFTSNRSTRVDGGLKMLREQIQWAVGGAPHIGEKPRRFRDGMTIVWRQKEAASDGMAIDGGNGRLQ
jgi:hypothetical protein